MKPDNKPIAIGAIKSAFALTVLFILGAVLLPYNVFAASVQAVRERKFRKSMTLAGRTMNWSDFMKAMQEGTGTLIVERFSFEGPVRFWWTHEDVREASPYPFADWSKMLRDSNFDNVRDWCNDRYTSTTGNALLVIGTLEQWRSISGAAPRSFREDVRWIEVPPARTHS